VIRRISALTLLACAVPAASALAASGSGGALAGPTAQGFTVSPAGVAPGGTVTFAFRAGSSAQARVDVITPGRPAVRARIGRVPAGRLTRLAWTPPAGSLPAGKYTARLLVSGRGTKFYLRAPLIVVAPTPPPPAPVPAAPASVSSAGVFPVQGPFTFGFEGARFGAGRPGHIHQGQDVVAAAGTPVVSPRAGVVHWVAYQAAGAGYYVVVSGDDGRDYVFMHFQEGSTAVVKDQRVTAGQRLGSVGNTGASEGAHLHFEIWPDGWWASKASQPIDPLPDLQAWSRT
jgi:murein DD-endopeptidase MepM/ murein hydrolase activator NlpD